LGTTFATIEKRIFASNMLDQQVVNGFLIMKDVICMGSENNRTELKI